MIGRTLREKDMARRLKRAREPRNEPWGEVEAKATEWKAVSGRVKVA